MKIGKGKSQKMKSLKQSTRLIFLLILGMLITASGIQASEDTDIEEIFSVNAHDDGLSTVNITTGEVQFISPLHPDKTLLSTPVAMAIRPSDGEIFVWNNSNGTGSQIEVTGVLLTVDRDTGLAKEVDETAPLQGNLAALAFGPEGRLFGMNRDLFEIDPSTGEKTFIESMDIMIGGADFDSHGTLFGVELKHLSQRLVTIDPDTAEVSVVAELSENIGVIGSIAFAPDGTLVGSGFGGPLGMILFDIDPMDGTVSNIRPVINGFPPQGMDFDPVAPSLSEPVTTVVDIKPGSCDNPVNTKSKGVVPVVILGTPDLDVSEIDLASIRLMDISPIRSVIKDTSSATEDSFGVSVSDCTIAEADGVPDLNLKFKTQELMKTLGDAEHNQTIVLTLTAFLNDGTEIVGDDMVLIKHPERKGSENKQKR